MATKTSLLGLTKPAYTEAADIAVLNTNFDLIDRAVGNGARAENLLVNSWFVNPIAQAGQNGRHGSSKYVCDRWISWDKDATFANECMTPGSPVDQRLDPNMISQTKTYTAAICLSDGTIKAASGTFASGIGSYAVGVLATGTTTPYVRLNTGVAVRWAALYEGAYTAETLPAYVYKGYAAELAECQRYYVRYSAVSNPVLLTTGMANGTQVYAPLYLPQPMRTWPTLTSSGIDLYPGVGSVAATDVGIHSTSQDRSLLLLYCNYEATASLPARSSAAMRITTGGYIDFSADL